jgi:hypothetical protein
MEQSASFPNSSYLHNILVSLWSDKSLIKNTLGMKAEQQNDRLYFVMMVLQSTFDCVVVLCWCMEEKAKKLPRSFSKVTSFETVVKVGSWINRPQFFFAVRTNNKSSEEHALQQKSWPIATKAESCAVLRIIKTRIFISIKISFFAILPSVYANFMKANKSATIVIKDYLQHLRVNRF